MLRKADSFHRTCFGSPPPEDLWHQLYAAPPSQNLPTKALLLPPSTGCVFSPHTRLSAQPGLAAAYTQRKNGDTRDKTKMLKIKIMKIYYAIMS